MSGHYYREAAPVQAKPRRKRRWGRIVLIVLLVLLIGVVAFWFYLDSKLNRINALKDYPGRPADTPGTNWLVVGSDSREGLSEEDREELATGGAAGKRTDTMMLLHIPDGSGPSTLVSLPRDSFVDIPGKKKQKLNAAFALGGAELLVRTVETNTGIHIDHYAEIGFGGFVHIVDAVGGVDMCIDKPMKDPKAGLDLQAGCQELDGAQALGYVRTRATPRADLDRIARQRQFLSALVDKATGFTTIINPFRAIPLANNTVETLTVNEGDHLHNLTGLAWAMRGAADGGLVTTTVPLGASRSVAGVGSVVQWDPARSKRFFDALKNDTPLPQDLITAG
ncbi:LCP family protein [Crossiella sp. CA198]|uniref:LCP family protein n=1 Tax=Crossiella sp. CA198 TaxID=3455607 RepID=UPI003F8D40E9